MRPRATTVALLALLALIALAGCGGFVDGPTNGSGGIPTPTETEPPTDPTIGPTTTTGPTTSASPATTSTTATEDRYPPGVSPEGVTDAMALAEAHADHLRNHSYTTNETVVTRFENGTVALRIAQETRRNGSAYRHSYRVSGPLRDVNFRRLDVWSDGTEDRSRWTLANGSVAYRRPSGATGTIRDASDWRETIYGRLEAGSFAIRSIHMVDPLEYRLTSEDLATTGVENATLEVVVDEHGFVHEYRYAYDRTIEGVTVHTVQTVEFVGLGETTVERPPWYEAATNATDG